MDIEAFESSGQDIGEGSLSREEIEQLKNVPLSDRWRAFLINWTRKESILKAIGTGLSNDPRRVNIGVSEDTSSADVATDLDGRAWIVSSYSPLPEYMLSVAVEGSYAKIVRIPEDGTL